MPKRLRLVLALLAPLLFVGPVATLIVLQSKAQQNQDPKTITVYITRTGKRYHRAGCRYLRFALYWRVIYPGSALIRRMWLRALRLRAERA